MGCVTTWRGALAGSTRGYVGRLAKEPEEMLEHNKVTTTQGKCTSTLRDYLEYYFGSAERSDIGL